MEDKIRVYALARFLGVHPHELLGLCQRLGIDAKNALTPLSVGQRRTLEGFVEQHGLAGSAGEADATRLQARKNPQQLTGNAASLKTDYRDYLGTCCSLEGVFEGDYLRKCDGVYILFFRTRGTCLSSPSLIIPGEFQLVTSLRVGGALRDMKCAYCLARIYFEVKYLQLTGTKCPVGYVYRIDVYDPSRPDVLAARVED